MFSFQDVWIVPLSPSPPPAVGPVLGEMPKDSNFFNGSSGLLVCEVRGLPPPIITWTKGGTDKNGTAVDEPVGTEIDGRVQVLENGSLFFQYLIMEDTGMYTCNINDTRGNVTQTDSALVIVYGK